jgi:hypothetical protein
MVGEFAWELQVQIILEVERNTRTETVGCCETAKGIIVESYFLSD